MSKIFSGEKVYLRRDQPEDLELIWASMHNPEVRRLTGTKTVFTRAEVEQWMQRRSTDSSRLSMMIALQENDETIGEIEILYIDHSNHNAYLRLALFEEKYFGRGYGTEAMRLILDHVFGVMGLHRIELNVFSYNPRAIKSYEKVGFRVEGTQREAIFYDHQWHDSIIMGILAHEFRERWGR